MTGNLDSATGGEIIERLRIDIVEYPESGKLGFGSRGDWRILRDHPCLDYWKASNSSACNWGRRQKNRCLREHPGVTPKDEGRPFQSVVGALGNLAELGLLLSVPMRRYVGAGRWRAH